MSKTQAVSITMRASLPGLVESICDRLENADGGLAPRLDLAFALNEMLTNLQATIDGKHTLQEFAEHYCMTTQGETDAIETV